MRARQLLPADTPSPLLPPSPSNPKQKYPIAGYVKLPSTLKPFVSLPSLDHVVVVAKPTGDVSGGLDNYREARQGGREAVAASHSRQAGSRAWQHAAVERQHPSGRRRLQATTRDDRRRAPIFAVIDTPGKTIQDKGYLWIEARRGLPLELLPCAACPEPLPACRQRVPCKQH